MKLNLGCGFKKIEGYVNVDNYPECEPDVMHDLEKFPYPFEESSVDFIELDNVLEHLGQLPEVFNNVIKEIYRICKNGAIINIKVPHPRHDNFLSDPTHVRPILPSTMLLYSKSQNEKWIKNKDANTPMAIIHKVDFEIIKTTFNISDEYRDAYMRNEIPEDEMRKMMISSNNVIAEIVMEIKAIK